MTTLSNTIESLRGLNLHVELACALAQLDSDPLNGRHAFTAVKMKAGDAGFNAYLSGITEVPPAIASEPILLKGWNRGQQAAASDDPKFVLWQ